VTGPPGPVVVLAGSYSGAARLRHVLSGSTPFACTSGTGLLPLCAQAAATWQRVDNRDGPPSSLALSSIRALAASMITAMMAWTLPRRRRRAVRKPTPRYPALSWAVPAYPRASSPARWPNVSTAFSSASGTRRSRDRPGQRPSLP